jgi:hypothetical protein
MRIVRRGPVFAVAAIIALAVSACTTDGAPQPPSTGLASGSPSQATEPAASPTPSLEAVITVASVDVDGLHATVSGYVSGVIEDGGACRFVLTGPAGQVSEETTGIADRATTSCGAASIPIEALDSGTWSVRLEYHSDTADAVSEETSLEVP